ncbi:MAG: hypothetical protein ACREX0_02700 [Noviherbaspirillum sp.]
MELPSIDGNDARLWRIYTLAGENAAPIRNSVDRAQQNASLRNAAAGANKL